VTVANKVALGGTIYGVAVASPTQNIHNVEDDV
jgi:hypothetical protein